MQSDLDVQAVRRRMERVVAALSGSEAPAEGAGELSRLAASGWPGLPAVLARELVRALELRHQFTPFDAALRAQFEQLYESLVEAAQHGAGEHVEQREQRELSRLLEPLRLGPGVTSAEYSAELQLQVLGLRKDELASPLLDIGCGEQALFVEYCRGLGIEAYGIERHREGPPIIAQDWLEYEPGKAAFGMIVSHQAFSLHFLHHHLAPGDAAYRYARKYMALLAALKAGGAFVYAPGLPFIEAHLRGFLVRRTPLPEPVRGALSAAFRGRLDEDVAYAARITRKG